MTGFQRLFKSMTSLETFKEILSKHQIVVPEDTLEVFRDLIDMQSDMILDSWLETKKGSSKGVELTYDKRAT
jgi:hypothetical protein